MRIRNFITIMILIIILCSSISNVVLAVEINTNISANENTILNEKEEKLNNTEENINNISDNSIIEEETSQFENTIGNNTNIINNSEVTCNNSICQEDSLYVENTIDDNQKVNSQIRELLNMSNIYDVNELSTKVTKSQMDELILQLSAINKSRNSTELSFHSGIWIDEISRKLIVTFINNHSSYTYSVNQEGYLTCDEVLRDNYNLDLVEPEETEMDIAIHNVLKDDKNIVIKVSNIYYDFNNDNIINSTPFDSTTRAKAYEYEDTRIILLNSQYYNINEIEYNLPLSDNFIKILDNIQYKVLTGEIQFSQEQVYNKNEIAKSASFTDNGQALR